MNEDIRKILVPLDGSKCSFRALDKAIYLARQCHGTITGLVIIPVYTVNLGRLLTSLRNKSEKEAKEFLAKAKRQCAQNGIVFNHKIIFGNQSWEITEYAKYKKFNLIVIGSRGKGRVEAAFLGSVVNTVVHTSKIPVLVVKCLN